jgi:DinB superfamily
MGHQMDRDSVVTELDSVRTDFRALLENASSAELRRRSDGTRWTNRQLLFHMLFGYLLVTTLRPLVWAFAHCPSRVSRGFARCLDAAARPFHVVNYLGSLGGGRVLGTAGMAWLMDTVVSHLQRSLRRAPDQALARGMHFPVRWDPYFRDFMTVFEVYHYGTQHYDHHRRQLTLAATSRSPREH